MSKTPEKQPAFLLEGPQNLISPPGRLIRPAEFPLFDPRGRRLDGFNDRAPRVRVAAAEELERLRNSPLKETLLRAQGADYRMGVRR